MTGPTAMYFGGTPTTNESSGSLAETNLSKSLGKTTGSEEYNSFTKALVKFERRNSVGKLVRYAGK